MTIKQLPASECYVHVTDKSLPVQPLRPISFKYSLINPVSFMDAYSQFRDNIVKYYSSN
jgi:hypothetical protein